MDALFAVVTAVTTAALVTALLLVLVDGRRGRDPRAAADRDQALSAELYAVR